MTITVNQLLNSRNNKEIFSVGQDALVIDAIRIMNDRQVGALPVLENDKLVGILSERDYVRKIVLNDRHSSETLVREIMTAEVKTVSPSTTVDECMLLMSDHHIRHIPILDEDKFLGILSIMDIVKNIISEKELIIEQLEHYITDTV